MHRHGRQGRLRERLEVLRCDEVRIRPTCSIQQRLILLGGRPVSAARVSGEPATSAARVRRAIQVYGSRPESA